MVPQKLKSFFLIVCVLAFCLIPSIAQAKLVLSFKLQGGLEWLKAGDVNSVTEAYFNMLKYGGSLEGFTQTGGKYRPLHLGYEFGGDFIVQFNPFIGIGIGTGYIQSSRTSSMILSLSSQKESFIADSRLSSVPIRLSLFLSLPVSRKINLTANAGTGYYISQYYSQWQIRDKNGDWDLDRINAYHDAFGFQGGLGLEYKTARNIDFFIEAQARYAKLTDFLGIDDHTDNKGSAGYSYSGKLYYSPPYDPSNIYPPFLIFNGSPFKSAHLPIFNFSGINLMAGIRFHLPSIEKEFAAKLKESSGDLHLSLRLQGGINYFQGGDLNPGFGGNFKFLKFESSYYGFTQTGGYNALHVGSDIGGDLIFQINRFLGVGIGIEFIKSSQNSKVTDSGMGYNHTDWDSYSISPKLSSVPLKVGLFYSLPMSRKINFIANAGIGYYFNKLNYEARWEGSHDFFVGDKFYTSKKGIGFQGGLGIEYMLTTKMSFFLETQGRYARFRKFLGTVVSIDSPLSNSGMLYYVELHEPVLTWGRFEISGKTGDSGYVNPTTFERDAIIDFSGVSLQAGIRIHF